jgi:hypothetical protein
MQARQFLEQSLAHPREIGLGRVELRDSVQRPPQGHGELDHLVRKGVHGAPLS